MVNNVVHLITGLEAHGAERLLCTLVERMDRDRFRNVVVSMTDRGALGDRLEAAGIVVHTLDMPRGKASPAGLARLVGLLRREAPDILQSWLYQADLMATIARLVRPRCALAWNIRCSNMADVEISRSIRLSLKLLPLLSPLATAVVANSEAGRKVHQQMGYRPRRWAVIPNGFDTGRFRPDEAARARARARWGIGDGDLLIGFVARLDPTKDYAGFLQAARMMAEAWPNAAFVMIGKGFSPDTPELRRLAERSGLGRRLLMLGPVADIEACYAALDIFTLPSFTEGLPNVVGEAMSCGVPCVVTDVGDAAALVGDTGRIVPPGDAAALADAWAEAASLGERQRRALGAAARQRIAVAFSLPAMVSRYERLYQELVSVGV